MLVHKQNWYVSVHDPFLLPTEGRGLNWFRPFKPNSCVWGIKNKDLNDSEALKPLILLFMDHYEPP